MSDSFHDALGQGWLGTLIAGLATLVVGGVAGWFARRPLEKAGVLEAVNDRMRTFMDHLEGELERVTQAHNRCEERMDALEAERRRDEEDRRRDRGEIEQLRGQLRQEKQIGISAKRLGRVDGDDA